MATVAAAQKSKPLTARAALGVIQNSFVATFRHLPMITYLSVIPLLPMMPIVFSGDGGSMMFPIDALVIAMIGFGWLLWHQFNRPFYAGRGAPKTALGRLFPSLRHIPRTLYASRVWVIVLCLALYPTFLIIEEYEALVANLYDWAYILDTMRSEPTSFNYALAQHDDLVRAVGYPLIWLLNIMALFPITALYWHLLQGSSFRALGRGAIDAVRGFGFTITIGAVAGIASIALIFATLGLQELLLYGGDALNLGGKTGIAMAIAAYYLLYTSFMAMIITLYAHAGRAVSEGGMAPTEPD